MRDSFLKRAILKTMYGCESLGRELSKAVRGKFLDLYYKPRDDVDREYLEHLKKFNAWVWRDQKRDFIETANGGGRFKNPFIRFIRLVDFKISLRLLGAEYEDYFGSAFFKTPWRVRKKSITRQRLNFLKPRLNDMSIGNQVDGKDRFAENFKEEFAREFCVFPECSKEEFFEKFDGIKKIIVKPVDEFGGRGVKVFDVNEDLSLVYDEIKNTGEKLIAEEYIFQKGFLHDVNPDTLNTIRVTTLRRPDGEARVICAYFRAGGKGAVTDNHHSGGVLYHVSVETGELGVGTYMNGAIFKNHPSTGLRVTGKTVPHWDEIKKLCERSHLKAPYGINLIGWDVCLSDGDITLIEGNLGPGFCLMEEKEDCWNKALNALKEWRIYDKKIQTGRKNGS